MQRRHHGRHSPLSGQNGFTTTFSSLTLFKATTCPALDNRIKSKSAGELLVKLLFPYKGPGGELYLATLTITYYLKYRFDAIDCGSPTVIMK